MTTGTQDEIGAVGGAQAGWIKRLRRVPATLALAWLVVLIVLLWAVAPGLFTSYSGTVGVPGEQLRPPSLEHVLGTDGLGRDLPDPPFRRVAQPRYSGPIVQTPGDEFCRDAEAHDPR